MPVFTPPPGFVAPGPWIEIAVQGEANLLSSVDAGNIASGSVGTWVGTACTLSQTGPAAPDGSFPLRLTSTGGGTISAVTSNAAVVSGQSYTGLAAFQAASTGRSTQVQLVWKTSGGATISTSSGSVSSDFSGAYTTASVSAVAPPTAAFVDLQVVITATATSEQHYVASRGIFPSTVTTWSTGGSAGLETANVQFSDDSGVTWATLRYGANVALPVPSQQANVTDWEPIPNTPRLYRVIITDQNGFVSPASTPISAQVNPDAPWLIDVLQPDAGGRIRLPRLRTGGASPGGVASVVDWSETEQMSSAYGLDESFPVTTRGAIQGRTTTLLFYADSLDQYQALRALRKRQRTLRLVLPGYEAAYVIIGSPATGGSGSQVTYSELRTWDHTKYAVSCPLMEVAAP